MMRIEDRIKIRDWLRDRVDLLRRRPMYGTEQVFTERVDALQRAVYEQTRLIEAEQAGKAAS